jgi:hypothetical protein
MEICDDDVGGIEEKPISCVLQSVAKELFVTASLS